MGAFWIGWFGQRISLEAKRHLTMSTADEHRLSGPLALCDLEACHCGGARCVCLSRNNGFAPHQSERVFAGVLIPVART
jgi:hypothetical protein